MLARATSALVRRSCRAAAQARGNAPVAPAAASLGATRELNLHEFQSKILMERHNVNCQRGREATSAADAKAAGEWVQSENPNAELILKAQIHAGGRGKGRFINAPDVGGVQILTDPQEVGDYTEQMLGDHLVTKQTGAKGQLCSTVLINEGLEIESEKYFAILMDREHNGPVMVGSSEGGMDIEEVAETNPDAIVTEAIDIFAGVQPEQTKRMAEALGFRPELVADAQQQMSNLYDLFLANDCTQVEINPFAEGKYFGREGSESAVFCVDAKLNFDDNAGYRQQEAFDMRDTAMEDAAEVRADEVGLGGYVSLDGNIGCLVNGAGLAMATMDIIKLKGGEPANFLDVGGTANAQQVAEAFKIITSDKNVKAILINIFGGIVKCDVIAEGIVEAYNAIGLQVPLVVRLEGTNFERGIKLLNDANIDGISAASNLDDAAVKAVEALG